MRAIITDYQGATDGLRFGRARWSDGARRGFFCDLLNGTLKITLANPGGDYTDVSEDEAFRLPSLRAAVDERRGAA